MFFEIEFNFFGLYLSPINHYGFLEFYLKGNTIFTLYLIDILDYVEDKPEYLGNAEYQSEAAIRANTERFAFVNIHFYKVLFDAVRIGNWAAGKGGNVMSDNHIIGYKYHHGKLYNNSTDCVAIVLSIVVLS